jgi:hypothetical protein
VELLGGCEVDAAGERGHHRIADALNMRERRLAALSGADQAFGRLVERDPFGWFAGHLASPTPALISNGSIRLPGRLAICGRCTASA